MRDQLLLLKTPCYQTLCHHVLICECLLLLVLLSLSLEAPVANEFSEPLCSSVLSSNEPLLRVSRSLLFLSEEPWEMPDSRIALVSLFGGILLLGSYMNLLLIRCLILVTQLCFVSKLLACKIIIIIK